MVKDDLATAGDLVMRLLTVANTVSAQPSVELKEIATKFSAAITAERHGLSKEKSLHDKARADLQKERSLHGMARSDLVKERALHSQTHAALMRAESVPTAPKAHQRPIHPSSGSRQGLLPAAAAPVKAAPYDPSHLVDNVFTRPSFGMAPVVSQPHALRQGLEFGRLTPPSMSDAGGISRKRSGPLSETDGPVKRAKNHGGQQPVCIGCAKSGIACDHRSQCSVCKAANIKCVYEGCVDLFCNDTTCTRLHSYQWSYGDRPRWHLARVTLSQRDIADMYGFGEPASLLQPTTQSQLMMPPSQPFTAPTLPDYRPSPHEQSLQSGRRSPPVHPDRLAMQMYDPDCPATQATQTLYDPAHPPYEASGDKAIVQVEAERVTADSNEPRIKLEEGEIMEE